MTSPVTNLPLRRSRIVHISADCHPGRSASKQHPEPADPYSIIIHSSCLFQLLLHGGDVAVCPDKPGWYGDQFIYALADHTAKHNYLCEHGSQCQVSILCCVGHGAPCASFQNQSATLKFLKFIPV